MGITAAGVSATAAVIALMLTTLFNWNIYHQNWKRDRINSSIHICESFVFGDGKKANDDVTTLTTYFDNGKAKNRPFTKDIMRASGDEETRLALFDFANMLSVVATGLDADAYDVNIIQSCAGELFTDLGPELSDDGNHFLPLTGFERVACWSTQFAHPKDYSKRCKKPY